MLMRFIPLTLLLLLSFTAAFAQTVTVTPQEKTYTRPKPLSEYKKTFKIRRAFVNAATPEISKKITDALNPETVLDINIKEETDEYQWLEEADYEITYNDNGILAAKIWMEGSAAYPDGVTKYLVINTKTGDRMTIAGEFSQLSKLTAEIRKLQKKEVDDAIKEIKADKDSGEENPEELFVEKIFAENNLDEFTVTDEGVTFYYDYLFPHVIQALEPSGEYKFTWAQLKPFIKPGSLLARFNN